MNELNQKKENKIWKMKKFSEIQKNNGKKIAKQACKGRNKEKNLEMKHENGDINETIGN